MFLSFLSVCRHSFNEEADLLTFLQKGPFSTSMGSPWKPFLLLSVISGLSGKKFRRQCSYSSNSKTLLYRIMFLIIAIRRNGAGCTEISCNDLAVVNVTQLEELSFMALREGLYLYTLGEEESAHLM